MGPELFVALDSLEKVWFVGDWLTIYPIFKAVSNPNGFLNDPSCVHLHYCFTLVIGILYLWALVLKTLLSSQPFHSFSWHWSTLFTGFCRSTYLSIAEFKTWLS